MSIFYKTSKEICERTKEHIAKRKDNNLSLHTRWKSLNNLMMDGIDPNCIITLAGRSGSGKSSVANMIEEDICTINKDTPTAILNFSLEMLGESQMLRKLSGAMKCSTRRLRSIGGRLDEETYQIALKELDKLAMRDWVYYIEEPLTPEELFVISRDFINFNEGKWCVLMIDHAGLLKPSKEGSTDERGTLVKLQKALIQLKRLGQTSIIQLAQLNRDIESTSRRKKDYQYPNKADIMGSDSLYQASDYVIVIHRPEKMDIEFYGPREISTAGRVFMHILKNREGEEGMLLFREHFKENNLEEDSLIARKIAPTEPMYSTNRIKPEENCPF